MQHLLSVRFIVTLVAAGALMVACNTGTPVPAQVLDVACGMCIYKMPQAKGCMWAADYEGQQYLVQSQHLPKDHMNHSAEGMCNMKRQARVAGTIRGDRLVADSFELLPAKAESIPADPTFKVEGEH